MRPFDVFDALTVVGLAMLFVGFWWLKPAVALIVVGALVYLAGTRGERAHTPRKDA